MSRVLFCGLTRCLKVVQVQRLIVGDYLVKQNSIINKPICRFTSTKDDKSKDVAGITAELKKAEPAVASKCKKIPPNLEQPKEDEKIVIQAEKKDDHTKIWYIERIVSASLALLVPTALICPCPALDAGLAVAFVAHNYWALESVCVDYLNPSVIGEMIPKVAHILVMILSVVTLAGLFCFIHDDVGIAQSFLCLWTVGKDDPDSIPVEILGEELAEICAKKP